MRIQHSAVTDEGLVRTRNEDAYYFSIVTSAHPCKGKGHLFLVADGMGGHPHGDTASAMATRLFPELYYARPEDSARENLTYTFNEINSQIAGESSKLRDERPMGTTLSALVLQGRTAHIGHIGDTRVYMFRKGTLRQLTSDHISGGDEMNRGITRFMGMSSDSVPFEQRHEAVKDGDMFLLCSDGLTRHVNDQEIAGIMARQEPGAACRALLSKAMARGGKDNITLQIISCKEEPLLKVLLLAVSLSILAFLCLLPFFTMHHDRASQVKKGKQAIPASQKKANRGLPMKKVKEIRNQRHHDREDKKNGISYIERLSIY